MRHDITKPRHRSGFTFAEVMFAVIMLGIGSIMVAAIFPVAIQQTQNTADEAFAAQLARNAIQLITNATTADQFTANDTTTHPFASSSTLWDVVSSSVISQSDSRYAWVPFYSKRLSDGVVTVTIVVVRRTLHGNYSAADASASTGELVPRGVKIAQFIKQADGTGAVEITKDDFSKSVATNTFLVVTANGHVYRIGEKLSDSSTSTIWALMPGNGSIDDETVASSSASVIGRDWSDPQNDTSGYDGPSQDVAVYTALFRPR